MSKLSNQFRIGLFGAAPDTSNLGVSALFSSTISGLHAHLSNPQFVIFDHGLGKRIFKYAISEKETIDLIHIGVRGGKRIYRAENGSSPLC